MLRTLTALILVFALTACSVMPSGPSVLVLPGAGKCFDLFHNDDLICRKFVLSQLGATQQKPASQDNTQQDYDIAYMQCMYSQGHQIPVPGGLIYDSQEEEYLPPPPPNMPVPP